MKNTTNPKTSSRIRRHARIRKGGVSGTAIRPRLAVYKSNRYLHAQFINDVAGNTLVSGSTMTAKKGTNKMDSAKKLGGDLAKLAIVAGISQVVFDRGGFRYTGRVAEFATAAREGGLKF